MWQSGEIPVTGGINEYVSVDISPGSLVLEELQFYHVAVIGESTTGTNGIRIDAMNDAINNGTATNMSPASYGMYKDNVTYPTFPNPAIIDISWYGAACLVVKGLPLAAVDPVPDVANLPDLTDVCSVDEPLVAPTATDACAGAVIGTTTTIFPVTETAIITWTYDNGNIVTQNQNVIINDNIDPTITCVGNQNINLSEGEATYTVQGIEFDPTAIDDNCDIEGIINDFNSLPTLSGAELPIGSTIITWTVNDKAGNTDNCYFYVVVNGFADIKGISEFGISVYPNPISDKLTINMSDFSNNADISFEITDITGKIIYKSLLLQSSSEIDLSSNSSGVYFLRVQTSEKIITKKILKK